MIDKTVLDKIEAIKNELKEEYFKFKKDCKECCKEFDNHCVDCVCKLPHQTCVAIQVSNAIEDLEEIFEKENEKK